MEALEVLKLRRSVREYLDKPVSKDILEKIVDVARFATTARNIQPWEFIVITDKGKLEKIAALAENGRFVASAAACIAVYCEDTKYYLEDGCAATQNILLGATALGVGSCWIAGDKKPYCVAIAEILSVPKTKKLVSLVALGYPKDKNIFKIAEKKLLRDLIHWEKF